MIWTNHRAGPPTDITMTTDQLGMRSKLRSPYLYQKSTPIAKPSSGATKRPAKANCPPVMGNCETISPSATWKWSGQPWWSPHTRVGLTDHDRVEQGCHEAVSDEQASWTAVLQIASCPEEESRSLRVGDEWISLSNGSLAKTDDDTTYSDHLSEAVIISHGQEFNEAKERLTDVEAWGVSHVSSFI